MKEIIYDGQACRQGTRNVRPSRSTASPGAWQSPRTPRRSLATTKAMVIIRDAEHPTDWFIRKAEVGYVLNTYDGNKSTSSVFFDKRLASDVLASFKATDANIRMGVAAKPDEEGRYALLYWKFADKGGAR